MGILSMLARRLGQAGARAERNGARQIMLRLDDLPERGSHWVDQAKVRGYGDMLGTSEPPPILVARRPGGDWEILDGWHRAAMMRQAQRREIPAMDVSERVRW